MFLEDYGFVLLWRSASHKYNGAATTLEEVVEAVLKSYPPAKNHFYETWIAVVNNGLTIYEKKPYDKLYRHDRYIHLTITTDNKVWIAAMPSDLYKAICENSKAKQMIVDKYNFIHDPVDREYIHRGTVNVS